MAFLLGPGFCVVGGKGLVAKHSRAVQLGKDDLIPGVGVVLTNVGALLGWGGGCFGCCWRQGASFLVFRALQLWRGWPVPSHT